MLRTFEHFVMKLFCMICAKMLIRRGRKVAIDYEYEGALFSFYSYLWRVHFRTSTVAVQRCVWMDEWKHDTIAHLRYELKNDRFHYEAHKNNEMIRNQNVLGATDEYKTQLLKASQQFATQGKIAKNSQNEAEWPRWRLPRTLHTDRRICQSFFCTDYWAFDRARLLTTLDIRWFQIPNWQFIFAAPAYTFLSNKVFLSPWY